MSGCSTCDDYELVPAADGFLLERCPDCRPAVPVVRCPVHGRATVGGKCLVCGREADLAVDLLAGTRRVPGAKLQETHGS